MEMWQFTITFDFIVAQYNLVWNDESRPVSVTYLLKLSKL